MDTRIVATYNKTLLLLALFSLAGCASPSTDSSSRSLASVFAIPLWFDNYTPQQYLPPQVLAERSDRLATTYNEPSEKALWQTDLPETVPLTPIQADKARLEIQQRLDRQNAARQAQPSGALVGAQKPQSSASGQSLSNTYRQEILVNEKIKATESTSPPGGLAPGAVWSNTGPGSYAPALKFRVPAK